MALLPHPWNKKNKSKVQFNCSPTATSGQTLQNTAGNPRCGLGLDSALEVLRVHKTQGWPWCVLAGGVRFQGNLDSDFGMDRIVSVLWKTWHPMWPKRIEDCQQAWQGRLSAFQLQKKKQASTQRQEPSDYVWFGGEKEYRLCIGAGRLMLIIANVFSA